jgi:hypothetical protein
MNRLFHTCKQLIGIAALSVELYACDWIHDDSLPLCEFRLYFKYDYNMKFADAFQHEVDFVTSSATKKGTSFSSGGSRRASWTSGTPSPSTWSRVPIR